MIPFVLVWGGGDLASGVAIRLHRVGIRVLIVETAQPMAVRRTVSFAQAVYDGEITIEDVRGQLIHSPDEMQTCWDSRDIPVLVDPELKLLDGHYLLVLVDSRMRKVRAAFTLGMAELVIGLGPGFTGGENCHAAVETNRGHFLGRVHWEGSTQDDTGVPGKVGDYAEERVLHTLVDGQVKAFVDIGDWVEQDDLIMTVGDHQIRAPFTGLVRGLIHPGLLVTPGAKVGDIDPRPDPFRCWTISEKSLAIGGGVLEAILTRPDIRNKLWDFQV
jgi:xanthine dehydrogenase accessory factor